jgi:hypothetical protein
MIAAFRRALFLCAATFALGAASRVSYTEVRGLEKAFDRRVVNFNADQPMDLIGFTRGVYLDDYGVVFTTEVNLLLSPGLTPFRPKFTPEELTRLRQKKLDRVSDLKRLMRDMMVSTGTTLKQMPPEQRVVVGVSLFYHAHEDTKGLPSQIVMQAPRKTLVEFESGKLSAEALAGAIQVQEF